MGASLSNGARPASTMRHALIAFLPCVPIQKKPCSHRGKHGSPLLAEMVLCIFRLLHDGLERFGVVHGQVGQHLAVHFDTGLVQRPHELGVRHAFEAGGGVDTLYPQGAEVAFFHLAVAVSIQQPFFPGIFRNGPHVLAGQVIAPGKAQDSFPSVA